MGSVVLLTLGELLAIGLALGAIALLRREQPSVSLAAVLWGLLTALTALLSAATISAMGGGFGPGAMMQLVGVCLAPVLVPVLWVAAGGCRLLRQPGARLGGVVGLLGLSAAMCGPGIGAMLIERGCGDLDRRRAAPLIARLDAHRAEHGRYPADLGALSIDPMPTPESCRSAEGAPVFLLEDCGEGRVLLTFPSLGQSSVERYDLAAGRWHPPVSFLDGACSHLSD